MRLSKSNGIPLGSVSMKGKTMDIEEKKMLFIRQSHDDGRLDLGISWSDIIAKV